MMYLYNKLTTDFSVNGQPIRNAYDAYVVRGEGFQLRFNLLLDENEEYKLIKKEMIISAMTPDGENYFRVWDIVLHSTHVEIIALQLMYDFDNKLVKPFAVNRATGQTVINVFKNNFKSSLGNFTISSSVQEVHDFTLDDTNDAYNALEVLQRIAVRWDSELSVDGYDIRMIKRLGKRTNALLHENKNISEFEDTSTTRGLATRIYAKSAFRASDGDEEDTIIEVTVDSPLINEYSQIYEKHYTNNDARTEQELINWVNLKYSTDNMDKPKRTIESATHIIDGTEINYGDDLVLKYHSHDVDEVIRCVGYEYDPLTETFYGITLGGFRQSYTDAISNRVVDLTESINLALRERMNQIANEVQIVTATANGLNRETWGPNPVPNPREGDKWFYFTLDRPNEVEFRQYDGTKWVTLMDDYYGERVKKRIEEIREEAEKLADDITEAQQSADDAKRDAGLALTASEALEIITQETASQLSDTRGLLATVESNASEALSQAGQATIDAQTAMSDAQTALSTASGVESTVNTLSSEVDEVAGKVELKADKSVVDTLSGTVSTHTTTLSQHATAISSKAEQKEVDTVKGTVSTHTTTLSQHATAISSKAEQKEVDTVKGTVSTHTSTLSQHAKDISVRLTQTQVNSLVTDKGYSTVSYVDAQMTATAGAIRTEMTKVEGKIDGLEIGGRNYALGTDIISENVYSITVNIPDELKGKQITVSFYLELENGTAGSQSRIGIEGNNKNTEGVVTYYGAWHSLAGGNNYKGIVQRTFTINKNFSGNSLTLKTYQDLINANIKKIGYIKVEKGNTATDWTPAPEDMATSQQVSSIEQKADSIQALVGTTKESVARAVMTSSLWETEVASEIESALESTTESKTIYPEVAIVSGLDLNLFGRGSGSYRETSQYVKAITTAESLRVYVTIDPDGEDLGGNGTLQVIYGGVSSNVATIYKSLRNYEYFFTLEVPADANRGGSFTFRYVIDGTAYRWGAIKKVAVYRTEIVEEETGTGAIASKISQLSNLISLALTGSEGDLSSLALSARGVSIKGEIINLDGKVKMTEGFAKKFMVEEMTADTVEAFTGTFANVIANNIDVNNIAGNKASFIQLLLNGTNTALRATSSVVDIMRNDGSISTRLTQNGMEIWRDGSKVGNFESRSSISESGALANKKSISMTPERDSYISLGYYKSGETTSTRVLSVAGDTGRIYIGSALYPSESSTYGLQIQRYTLNSSGGIRVGSTGGSSGIFFGDFGHVSVQFNGAWYSMNRLIN